MARALVLGATGHIGAHIVRALLAEGHLVKAAYRRSQYLSVLDGLCVERVAVDLDTLDGLPQALSGCDWVFHAAGYYPPLRQNKKEALSGALRSLGRMLEAIAQAQPARVVFTSSASTIQRLPDRPSTEADAELLPGAPHLTVYAAVKTAMEHEALAFAKEKCLPLIVTHPSICIGEYDAHVFSGRLILIFAKHRLPFVVQHRLNVVYTADVGLAHVRAAERGRAGERYILCGENLSLRDFAEIVAEEAGVRKPRWVLPHRAALGLAWITELAAWITRSEPLLPRQAVHRTRGGLWLDGAKAIRELGMPRTSTRESVRRAMRWFRDSGLL